MFYFQLSRCRDLNSGPLPYQGSALPLSYNSKKKRAEDGAQTRDPQLGRLMLYQLSYFRILAKVITLFLWAKMDSNHRSRKTADLQSAPFGHSGICPYNSLNKRTKIKQYNKLQRSIFVLHFLSLLSDSNQRPRDYKSRALAN